MTDLFISFKDENSDDKRIAVDADSFVIGRHSDCDLTIRDGRLSRRHLKIERFGDIFVASDLNSSNGTKVNGRELDEPVSIGDGDVLELGGLRIEVENEGDESSAVKRNAKESDGADTAEDVADEPSAGNITPPPPAAKKASPLSNPFILAPVLGLLFLIVLGLGILIISILSGSEGETARSDDGEFNFPLGTEETPEDDPFGVGVQTGGENTQGTGETPVSTPDSGPTPVESGSPVLERDEKVRGLVINFMRSIAQRDPNPVITSEPLRLVDSRIERLRGSPALAANINNARNSASQIRTQASSKNLRPDFLTAAAIAKLGTSRGDVAATAGSMIDVLSQLKIQIGDAFANEAIVIIAAYDQGVAGEYLAMRDTMTRLADANPTVSSRKVRTIWFLKEQGKISDAQFEFALRFLAVGAILQDPAAFGVDAQPLRLN